MANFVVRERNRMSGKPSTLCLEVIFLDHKVGRSVAWTD
jgi:hypothetical protein